MIKTPQVSLTISPRRPTKKPPLYRTFSRQSTLRFISKSEEDETVENFLYTDAMEREQEFQKELHQRRTGIRSKAPPPVLQRQPSEIVRKKHERVIRQILHEFDLQECMERYRNMAAYEKHPTGKT